MTFKEYIEDMKKLYLGKGVILGQQMYTVVDVDANGCLLIDMQAQFTDTTAVSVSYILKNGQFVG